MLFQALSYFVFGYYLPAQAAGVASETWPAFVGSIASSGFAIWCAWYLVSKQIPAQQAEFSCLIKEVNDRHTAAVRNVAAQHGEAVEKIAGAHSMTVERLCNEFRSDQREMRADFRESSNRLQNEMSRTTMAVDKLCDKLNSPGPLRVTADSVVVRNKREGDSTGEMDTIPG